MITALKKRLFPDAKLQAHALYVRLVEQSRKAFFYREFAVPDTVDGRFDVILLHLFLVIHRLQMEPSAQSLTDVQLLSEAFFADMDRNVREMGSTDTGTGKRVQKMGQAFYGRLQAYGETIADKDKLEQSLHRNLYRQSPLPAPLDLVAGYMQRNQRHLAAQSGERIRHGIIEFID